MNVALIDPVPAPNGRALVNSLNAEWRTRDDGRGLFSLLMSPGAESCVPRKLYSLASSSAHTRVPYMSIVHSQTARHAYIASVVMPKTLIAHAHKFGNRDPSIRDTATDAGEIVRRDAH